MKLLRDVGDVADIGRDVVTHLPVSAGEGLDQTSVPVAEANGRAVEFELAAPVELAPLKPLGSSRREFLNLSTRIGVGKGEHGVAVRALYKTARWRI